MGFFSSSSHSFLLVVLMALSPSFLRFSRCAGRRGQRVLAADGSDSGGSGLLALAFSPRLSFVTTTTRLRRGLSTSPLQAQALLNDNVYDVIVVGGGHAGCDAAAAAARMGARTALVTQRLDTVGELSCNPSVGGIGKGHLVREIDALDGVMGKVADAAGIHFRVLNRKKGPAVRGPRAQMDRDLYKAAMQATLALYPNLHLIEASVQDLLLDESHTATSTSMDQHGVSSSFSSTGLLGQTGTGSSTTSQQQERWMREAISVERKARIRGVVVETTDNTNNNTRTQEILGHAVVLTTGTFLRGVLMLGRDRYSGGRHLRDSEHVEPPSVGLALTLDRFQFPLGRLKTGTPPRLDGTTIDWDLCAVQPSEVPAQPFSHLLQFRQEQPPMVTAGTLIRCHQTATNEETHQLCLDYEHLLPEYDGGMDNKGNGPRYCPSIYRKVQRFPDRTSHNCFLEPEGLNTNIVYPNGMSGPYPPDIQLKILRSMRGLGAVDIVRPGYDVEYDYVNPTSLLHTLETKKIGGMYLAGQICGTTGYEEAAAQGIVAGANAGIAAIAAASSSKKEKALPFVIGRDEGYIGVLIDDLVTRGTLEPYRMFTSRSEYRISLRADNADLRLTRKGVEYGLVVDPERISAVHAREELIDERIFALSQFELKVTEWSKRGGNALMGGAQVERKMGQKKSAEEVLQMPHVTLKDVETIMMAAAREENTSNGKEGEHEQQEQEQEQQQPLLMTPCPPSVYDTVEASVKYKSYVRRQFKDMESWRKAQGLRIPLDIVYSRTNLPTLSIEELEKLSATRPDTFAEASAMSGMTPQSLVYLYHYVNRRNRDRDSAGGKTTNNRRGGQQQQHQQASRV